MCCSRWVYGVVALCLPASDAVRTAQGVCWYASRAAWHASVHVQPANANVYGVSSREKGIE